MQIDQNPFLVHTLELSNPKVLIRPHQAASAKGKNVIIGEERNEKGVLQKKTSRVVAKASTLEGQDKEKGADSKSTGLTGPDSSPTGLTDAKTDLTGVPSKFGNASGTKDKKRSSFKELLAKYEKKGAARKQKDPSSKVKDTKQSSEHQERSDQGNYVSSNGPIAP
jgi:hypothetical protein